ncbi:glycoside hydrolase family 32 protein [Saliterribacillus persicus]|uniref:Sucrose-6-phosphate hydrolase n=1 Tax=Saliterribacillus persicus TaxID=930114 RepID=A0A368X5Q7_9BACI|nr:glycoside hydrolase family 32 protein [Saliterribacillus persicus]RCW63351.1 beta-fructofuranosidase [Saliterribacillus persicus]
MTKNHREQAMKANVYINQQQEKVKNTKYRLNYHMMPPVGWMNDPNGFVQYNGEYHLFYQHNPYAAQWGPMHWGHAKSRDLVNWEHLPVALAPSEYYDNGTIDDHGCFSGSAIEKDSELYLLYTGHSIERNPMQVQCIAKSRDGIDFIKENQNPVIDHFPKDGSKDFRDPKVWEYDNQYYMVVGSNKDGKGKALFYQSSNLIEWEYRGVVAESNGKQGDMWECPDLFPLEEEHALIFSPMYGEKNEKPIIIFGEMDYKKAKFSQGKSMLLDYGHDFYAPQTLIDEKGRRIMIGWMDMWFSKRPSEEDDWAGAMTIPRELTYNQNGKFVQKPIEELKTLRKNHHQMEGFDIDGVQRLPDLDGSATELCIDFDIANSDSSVFGLQLRCSKDRSEKTMIKVDTINEEIIVDLTSAGKGESGIHKAPYRSNTNGKLNLRLFLDTTSLEVFVNHGEQVITNRIYPHASSNEVDLFAEGGKIKVLNVDKWSLRSVWK